MSFICSCCCSLPSVTGDNRWGWPRLDCICQDGLRLLLFFVSSSSSSFLVVPIPHSSFSTEILVSTPGVAFLLLISIFQVRHDTEEWRERIWEGKRRHSKVCGFIFISEHFPVYWSLSSPPGRGNTVHPVTVRSGRVFVLRKRCEARAKL